MEVRTAPPCNGTLEPWIPPSSSPASSGQSPQHSEPGGRGIGAAFYASVGLLIAGLIVVILLVGYVLVKNTREEVRFQAQEKRLHMQSVSLLGSSSFADDRHAL